ncbi:MAG: amino acid--tRNA ligase-related protein [Patescibacteria group bacterium]
MSRILSNQVTERVGKTVLMQGWAQTVRVHAKVVFIDLRDRAGLTQLVFTGELVDQVRAVTTESVISVTGKVIERPKSLININIVSGSVELQVEKLTIETLADPLPFPLTEENVSEEVRFKYRYLDIRRQNVANNLRMRSNGNQFIRTFLSSRDFVEIETPYISKSTPEGARDYLVPSRTEPGKFYALPQSPQQYKQLLMVAGIERYFQIARCFRDEDSRGDRQPEFTQLDLEMSFTNRDEVMELVEELFTSLVKDLFPEKVFTFVQFPRLKYADVMKEYHSDKPDLRKDKGNDDELAFAFIIDFPLFEWKETEKRYDATHHPFTSPTPEYENNFEKKPAEAVSLQYDLVLNGSEIAGGSIRINKPDVLERVFAFMGHSKEGIQAKFGHLLEAFRYGVPPHGGIAPGLDRFYAILLKEDSIRDVIAFPKTGDGHDLLMNAPSEVDASQLKELGLQLRPKK